MRSAYQTDLSDAEWSYVEPHLPVPKAPGRPRVHTLREILDAIFYILRSGCAWRLSPHDFLPWKTIHHYFRTWWRLSRPVEPEEGEELNRRLAYAMSADLSGWDLTQLLRVPGTRNRKYPDAPVVKLAHLSEGLHDPAELAAALPKVRDARKLETARSMRPREVVGDADFSRLSESTRELVLFGNRTGRYASRSEADFAACLGMFAAGFEEAEVWAAMTNPTHGISEKFLEKGWGRERYLSLTIGKAAAKSSASRLRAGRSKAQRVRRRVA